MAVRGPRESGGFRNGHAAVGVLLGVLAAAASVALGAGFWQAAGFGFLTLGASIWLGTMRSIRPDPALDERSRRQRHRSVAIALGLGALVIIFYTTTIVRLGPNALRKDGLGDYGSKNVVVPDPDTCKRAGTC